MRMTTRLITTVLVAVPLLAGCSDTGAGPRVASLPEAATVGTDAAGGDGPPGAEGPGTEPPSTEPPSTERPVLRVDDTEERRKALWNAYNTCLLDHGAKEPPPDGLAVALGDVLVQYPGPEEAQQACLPLEPVQPPALDAATNPDFQDQAQAFVACLREGGLWVERLSADTLDWTYAEGHPVPDDSVATEQRCLVEVFGDAG